MIELKQTYTVVVEMVWLKVEGRLGALEIFQDILCALGKWGTHCIT